MMCGSPQSIMVNLTGENEQNRHFSNWTWNSYGDIILSQAIEYCELPRYVTVYYNSSVSNVEQPEVVTSFLQPVTFRNLIVEGVVVYTSSIYVMVNYSNTGVCSENVWQLEYVTDGEEVISNYTSRNNNSCLEIQSNRTAAVSAIRGRVHQLSDGREGNWSEPFYPPLEPVISYNSRIGENFSFNVHYPQPPAHLEYVLIKYNKGGQVTTMQLDSPINGTNYIHLPHACNVTLAAFTAFNGLLVKPDVEWISVPGSQCIPSVFYVEGVVSAVLVIATVGISTVLIIAAICCVVRKHRSAEEVHMAKILTLEVEVNNERYVNPGHVECDTGTIYDYPISDPDPGTVCSDVDIGPPLMPVSVHYTCTPVHYTLEHEPHSKDET
jgi:hypothetical protein